MLDPILACNLKLVLLSLGLGVCGLRNWVAMALLRWVIDFVSMSRGCGEFVIVVVWGLGGVPWTHRIAF